MRESQGSGRLMKYHHSKMYAIKLLSGILAVLGFPSGWDSRVCLQCRRPVFSPWVGWSTGEGNGYPPQYSFLDNSMDRGAWWTTVHEVTKSQTQANNLNTQQGLMWAGSKKSFPFTHAIPRIATWWCQMAYVCLFSTGKTSKNLFFFLLYLQGYQGVLSLLFINIFNQGLIHKKVLNGKSENLERVVNWGEKKGERK